MLLLWQQNGQLAMQTYLNTEELYNKQQNEMTTAIRFHTYSRPWCKIDFKNYSFPKLWKDRNSLDVISIRTGATHDRLH